MIVSPSNPHSPLAPAVVPNVSVLYEAESPPLTLRNRLLFVDWMLPLAMLKYSELASGPMTAIDAATLLSADDSTNNKKGE